MLVSKCVSLLLSAAISITSTMSWAGPMPVEEPVSAKPLLQPVVEETIDISVVEDVVAPEPEPEQLNFVTEDVVIDEPAPQPTVEYTFDMTDSEIDLIALVTMAEAEAESEMGKRLVIDVILNRYDSPRFPNTISGVIYAKNAFECMWNGRVNRCYVRDDIRQLVLEELQSRTNSNIHYFRTNHYHSFGVPVLQEGNHYFSTY